VSLLTTPLQKETTSHFDQNKSQKIVTCHRIFDVFARASAPTIHKQTKTHNRFPVPIAEIRSTKCHGMEMNDIQSYNFEYRGDKKIFRL
jgi:hypothetical protein